MIKRWAIQCDICECTDVAHEMDDGDMVFLDDIKPLIEQLMEFESGFDPIFRRWKARKAHNIALQELRTLLTA